FYTMRVHAPCVVGYRSLSVLQPLFCGFGKTPVRPVRRKPTFFLCAEHLISIFAPFLVTGFMGRQFLPAPSDLDLEMPDSSSLVQSIVVSLALLLFRLLPHWCRKSSNIVECCTHFVPPFRLVSDFFGRPPSLPFSRAISRIRSM